MKGMEGVSSGGREGAELSSRSSLRQQTDRPLDSLLTKARLFILISPSRKADDDVRVIFLLCAASVMLCRVRLSRIIVFLLQTFLVMPNVIRAFSEMDCSKNMYWGTTAGGAYHFPRYMRGLGYALSWPLVSSPLPAESRLQARPY